MSFLRNTWYVGGWSDEIADGMFARTLLNESVLFYRDSQGQAVAIGNRCAHRFAPLNLGRLENGVVECPYHGLRYDGSGACVHNPHGDGSIPKNARVKKYPLVERYDLLWIWMGEPEEADAAKIPDFQLLVAPEYRTIKGMLMTKAGYEIVTDNLLDLSHIQFIHANYHKMENLLTAPHEVVEEGMAVISRRWVPGVHGPASLMRNFADPNALVDFWMRVKWQAPGLCGLDFGATLAGRPESEGIWRRGTHLLTPETETTTHYFFASTRNYRRADPEEDHNIAEWQRIGFNEQDKPMLEAVQGMMGTTDLMSLRPVFLSADKAAIRARRILADLLQRESQARHAA